MTKQITIQIRNVYGEEKAYPVCSQAKIFADMLGTKTLTPSALKSIQALGYEVLVHTAYGTVNAKLAA